MPDDPFAKYFDQGGGGNAGADPFARYFEAPKGAPVIASPPNAEELRAARVRALGSKPTAPITTTPGWKGRGLVTPGNIDLMNRPRVVNPEGGISTVLSRGMNINGEEVLLPMVTNEGRILPQTPAGDEEAKQIYLKTGKHLGKFQDVASSNAYAQALHLDQAKLPMGTGGVSPNLRELARIHFGENVPAGQRAAAVSPFTEALSGAAEQANEFLTPPAGIWEAAKKAPGLLYQAATRPASLAPQIAPIPGQILGSMGQDIKTMGEGTPREAGKASVRFAATAYPVAKAVTSIPAGVRAITAEGRAATALENANRRMMKAMDVSPKFSEARQVAAIDETTPTLKAMSPGKQAPFSDVESHAKFARKSADSYLKQYHGDLADQLKGVMVDIDGVATPLDEALAERASLNKRTHAYQTATKDAKGIMREINNNLDAEVDRLNRVREGINKGLDAMAPQSQSQADIMRRYSHLQELADMAEANAHEWKTMKRLEAGGKDPKGTMLWNMMTKAGTLGLGGQSPQVMAKFSELLRNAWKAPKVDRDVLMARAAKHWKDITPAELPKPVPKPTAAPAAEAAPAATTTAAQQELPFQVAPVPQPPSISGGSSDFPPDFQYPPWERLGSTSAPRPTNASTTTNPAMRAASEAPTVAPVLQPNDAEVLRALENMQPIEVPTPEQLMERRTYNRILSGEQQGPGRRATDISPEFKESVAEHRRRQKATNLYRKMSERRPGERGSISIKPVPNPKVPTPTPGDVLNQMSEIKPGAARGHLVSIEQLRQRFPNMSKEAFDNMVLDMARSGEYALHHHDFPSSLSAAERNNLVHERTFDNKDIYYLGIAKR